MIALFVIAAIVGTPTVLVAAFRVADEGDGSRSARPAPPRPARPAEVTGAVAWVDPEADDRDAAWTDPEAVAA